MIKKAYNLNGLTSTVLKYYDPNAECVLSVDTSSTGVGAVIMQNSRTMAYTSRPFTTS